MTTSTQSELGHARSLRSLYFTRTLVQLVWAGVVITSAISHPDLAATLLIFYPLWDVACTVYDVRTSPTRPTSASTAQYVNMALGLLAAAAIALTVLRSPQHAVVAFGLWACVAGLAQLAVGLFRRKQMGGQWAMILSGLQSTAAGLSFILGALKDKVHIKDLGAYAIFGGVYFLIAGFLLHRKLSKASAETAVNVTA